MSNKETGITEWGITESGITELGITGKTGIRCNGQIWNYVIRTRAKFS